MYQEAPFINPYVGSITQLITEPARARADAIRAAAAAQAQAAARSGQIWGQTLSGIGQQVAAIPQQRQQREAQAQETQVRGLQLTEAQRAAAARTAMAKILKATPMADANGLPQYDVPAVSKALTDQGFGDLVPDVGQHLAAMNTSLQQAHAAKLAVVQQGAKSVIAAGNDPQIALHFLDTLGSTGLFTPAELADYRALIEKDPANVAKLTAYLAGPQTMQNAAPGSMARNPLTGEVVPGSQVPTTPNPSLEETARHNAAMEQIQSMNAGRAAATAAEQARHNRAMENLQNPFGGVDASGHPTGTPGPQGAVGPTGEDYLKTLSPDIAAQVKAYAEGRQPFPTGMSAYRLMPLIKMVTQYDPTFDAANYNARNKARMDLTSPSGTGGKTINALNTALQHAGELSDLIEKLDNYASPLVNAVVNPARTALGSTAVTNFKAVAPQLAKEIERAWRGSGGSTADIKDLVDSISQNYGIQQQREALAEFVDLLKGKLDATQTQRDNIMGAAAASIPILFPQNQSILEKIVQRAQGAPAATAPPASAGVIEAVDPHGVVHHAPAGTPIPPGWRLR